MAVNLLITISTFSKTLSDFTTLCKIGCQTSRDSKSLYKTRLEQVNFMLNSFTISACAKPNPSSFNNSNLLATLSKQARPPKNEQNVHKLPSCIEAQVKKK